MPETLYDFTAKTLSGETLPLSRFKGQVVLVVNTASHCGFTPQYKALQALYETYGGQGFSVLGFPCNQFMGQEPGDAATISSFCELNYGVTFPLFEKIDVRGEKAHPLFVYLTHALPGVLGIEGVKWNFTKFLIDRAGHPFKRYAPSDTPESIEGDIVALLGKLGI